LDLDFSGSLTCIAVGGCGAGTINAGFTFTATFDSFFASLPYSINVMGTSDMTNASSKVIYTGDFDFTTTTVGPMGNYDFTHSGTALFTNQTISQSWGVQVTGPTADGGVITFSDPGLLLGNSTPEPATFGLLGAGLGGLILAYRKRRS
jgi:hypothetical protein